MTEQGWVDGWAREEGRVSRVVVVVRGWSVARPVLGHSTAP